MKDMRERGRGPWDDEPETFDFTDDVTGYPIALRRNTWGAWCGYIGVPNDHALFGKGYDTEIPGAEIDDATKIDQVGVITVFCHAGLGGNPRVDILVRCHGGLTYADKGWWPDETRAAWWFGFDCSHSDDLCPAKDMQHSFGPGIYRDIEYVKECCRTAAADLSRFKSIVQPMPVIVQEGDAA